MSRKRLFHPDRIGIHGYAVIYLVDANVLSEATKAKPDAKVFFHCAAGTYRTGTMAALYRTYGGILRGRCRRLLGDAAAAEDATHEVFLRVQRHLERRIDARTVSRGGARRNLVSDISSARGRRRQGSVSPDMGRRFISCTRSCS